jgi:hypothetical protein
VRYVEGQRSRCPWFYFLPLEDILQFVCYGESQMRILGKKSFSVLAMQILKNIYSEMHVRGGGFI